MINAQDFYDGLCLCKTKGPVGDYRLIFEWNPILKAFIPCFEYCSRTKIRFSMRFTKYLNGKPKDLEQVFLSMLREKTKIGEYGVKL